jgi:hypothetical protein
MLDVHNFHLTPSAHIAQELRISECRQAYVVHEPHSAYYCTMTSSISSENQMHHLSGQSLREYGLSSENALHQNDPDVIWNMLIMALRKTSIHAMQQFLNTLW